MATSRARCQTRGDWGDWGDTCQGNVDTDVTWGLDELLSWECLMEEHNSQASIDNNKLWELKFLVGQTHFLFSKSY